MEELTKLNFVQKEGETIYLTGDLAKINFQEEIEILGRMDFQVKINGQRIELEEIENIINLTKMVKSNVTELVEGKLICFYKSESLINEKYVNDILKLKLPVYMIPKKYIKVDNFPMTTNGKIDRKKLRKVEIKTKEERVI